jgi:hypothetical protein
MISAAPLHRIRLELDRALRQRAFIARAIRGNLCARAYGELIIELSTLAAAADAELANDLEALAAEDLHHLATGDADRVSTCATAAPLRVFREACAKRVGRHDAHDACIAVFGSSWTRDASQRLARPHHGAVRFLSELGRQGPLRFAALQGRIENGRVETQHLYSFAELARGALLGTAAYLEHSWPAPVVTGPLFTPN